MSTWSWETSKQYQCYREWYTSIIFCVKFYVKCVILPLYNLYAAPSVTILANLNNMPLVVGQTGIILTCKIFGADNLNPTITYQWTRNNGTTQISIGTNLNTLSLPPLQLSDAGFYLCRVTSALLNNPVTTNTSVIIQGKLGKQYKKYIYPQHSFSIVPDPQHVTLTSSLGNIVISGSNVTLTCSVQMNSSVTDSEVSLLTVDAQLIRQNGTTLNLSHPDLLGTIFIYSTEVKFFDDNDAGNYTCMATVRRGPFSIFLTGIGELSGKIELRHEIGENKI